MVKSRIHHARVKSREEKQIECQRIMKKEADNYVHFAQTTEGA
jgi:hypothetical protein